VESGLVNRSVRERGSAGRSESTDGGNGRLGWAQSVRAAGVHRRWGPAVGVGRSNRRETGPKAQADRAVWTWYTATRYPVLDIMG
jgi:pyrroloquinoline quinone (PQQ) biosynthesis protein C